MAELRIPPTPRPTDRFKLTNVPLVSPGKCACCGAVDRPVVDFDMTIEFYGAVLFCVTCLTEAATVIDMVPAIELIAAEESATLSFDSQLKQRDLRTITNEQYQSISMAISNLSDAIFSPVSDYFDLVAESKSETDAGLFSVDADEPSGEPEDSKQGINPFVGEGSNSVPSSTSNGTFKFFDE